MLDTECVNKGKSISYPWDLDTEVGRLRGVGQDRRESGGYESGELVRRDDRDRDRDRDSDLEHDRQGDRNHTAGSSSSPEETGTDHDKR
jgi:hypothetical protein